MVAVSYVKVDTRVSVGLPATPAREAGFGLVEIVVAALIFSVAVLGIMRSTVTSRRMGDAGRFEAAATALAMDKIEELRAAPASAAALAEGSHVEPQSIGANGSAGIYRRSWRISSNAPHAGMKTVEVFVAWPSQLGGRSLRLITALDKS